MKQATDEDVEIASTASFGQKDFVNSEAVVLVSKLVTSQQKALKALEEKGGKTGLQKQSIVDLINSGTLSAEEEDKMNEKLEHNRSSLSDVIRRLDTLSDSMMATFNIITKIRGELESNPHLCQTSFNISTHSPGLVQPDLLEYAQSQIEGSDVKTEEDGLLSETAEGEKNEEDPLNDNLIPGIIGLLVDNDQTQDQTDDDASLHTSDEEYLEKINNDVTADDDSLSLTLSISSNELTNEEQQNGM